MNKLWQKNNRTMYSSVFNVPAGYCVTLFATGLLDEKVRQSAEEFTVPQIVCVRRLVHEYEKAQTILCEGCCGYIFDLANVRADTINDGLVSTCGRPWQLDPCRNIGIIGVPGTYRLHINDATAVGVAQVYADWYRASQIPSQVESLFFI